MLEGYGVDDRTKERLLEQLRRYLDNAGTVPDEPDPGSGDASADLFTVFVELAALRNEVRGESRLVKDSLDQFRAVFTTVQSVQATLEQELKRNQTEARERVRDALRPLLLELLELRDRLIAGTQQPASPVRWFDRLRRRRTDETATWREGLSITLRRLDRILGDRGVVPTEVVGRPFDPHRSRAVGTVRDTRTEPGTVVEEIRAGFLWGEDLLRVAEVIVNTGDNARRESAQ
jgi:molecular chaperone GrpE